jgi:hypothetical protein
MERLYSLLSLVFMMSFVLLFDRLHHQKLNLRFWQKGLLSTNEVEQLRAILAACQE